MQTKYLIVGAGISGLSLAYFLKEKGETNFLLSEFTDRPGGWIHTRKENGFLFEMGPRGFKKEHSKALCSLIEKLQLKEDLIFSSKKSSLRYLYTNKQLIPIPSSLKEALQNPYTRPIFFSFFNNLKGKKRESFSDESISSFLQRSARHPHATKLFEAFTSAIHAASMQSLSLRYCYPSIAALERSSFSRLKKLWQILSGKFFSRITHRSLFTLASGNEQITERLQGNVKEHLLLKSPIEKLQYKNGKIIAKTASGLIEAEHLFLATHKREASRLISTLDETIGKKLQAIPSTTIAAVHLGYKKKLLSFPSFGYVVPPSEDEKISAVVFESMIFPQKNQHPEETRICVKFGHFGKDIPRDKELLISWAKEALKNHLSIIEEPDAAVVTYAAEAIPVFEVGHEKKIEEINQSLRSYPITLMGSYTDGAFVNRAIERSAEIADSI